MPRATRTADGQTVEQVEADVLWWRSLLPEGWGMVGFNYRDTAKVVSPTGRQTIIDGEFAAALIGARA